MIRSGCKIDQLIDCLFRIESEYRQRTSLNMDGTLNFSISSQNFISRMFLQGVNLNDCDYDGRTALHICASEGHLDCTKFLINIAKVNTDCRDR